MHWLSIIGVLVLVLPAQAGENEAEKLFRHMEKKIAGAKTITVRSDTTATFTGMTSRIDTTIVFGEDNRVFFQAEVNSFGNKYKTVIVGTGAKISLDLYGKVGQPSASPKTLGIYYRAGLARAGGLGANPQRAAEGKELPNLDKMKVSDFKLGAKEKIEDAQTQIVEYTLLLPRSPAGTDPYAAKVWINTQTHLPAQLVLRIQKAGGAVVHTETYAEYVIDGKVDAKLFQLPK